MTFVETLSGNKQQDEYIKIDPNTDVTWENLGDILCEYILFDRCCGHYDV